MTFDSRSFRDTLGLFVTGVTVITTRNTSGVRFGVTANSFNSVSVTPPLILWSLAKRSGSLAAFESATHFAVHILRDNQIDLSNRFASAGTDKFSDIDTVEGYNGVPLLADCAARMECRTYDRHPGGDHIIFIGEVLSIESDLKAQPLVFHGGNYAALDDQGAS